MTANELIDEHKNLVMIADGEDDKSVADAAEHKDDQVGDGDGDLQRADGRRQRAVDARVTAVVVDARGAVLVARRVHPFRGPPVAGRRSGHVPSANKLPAWPENVEQNTLEIFSWEVRTSSLFPFVARF